MDETTTDEKKRRHKPVATPAQFAGHVSEILTLATELNRRYPLLHTSGYRSPDRGRTEATRNGVSGVSPGLQGSLIPLEVIREPLGDAGRALSDALGALRACRKALGRVEAGIDYQSRTPLAPVAPVEKDDPIPPPRWLRPMSPQEAKAAQERRENRAAGKWFVGRCADCSWRVDAQVPGIRDLLAKGHRKLKTDGTSHRVTTSEETRSTNPWAQDELY